MSEQKSPEARTSSGKRLLTTVAVTAVVAVILLVAVVLPAEYDVDPTGIGGVLGLTDLNESGRTIEIVDVIGGNETLREIEIPDAGEPVPLPNPNIHRAQAAPPETRTVTIEIPALKGTEIKTVLQESEMVVYSWQVEDGSVYCDFHGHDPAMGNDFWVRYQEDKQASGASGSLVAPFNGEHGWYWLNYNTEPIKITLTVTGYFDDIIDYGVIG